MTLRELQALILAYRHVSSQDVRVRIDYLLPELGDIAGPPIGAEACCLSEYHEDCGPVLWWRFPVEEPPYVGSPLDTHWPGYHTHWTVLPPAPEEPR